MLLAAVAGIILGVPALRLEGPYLTLVTLIAPLVLAQIFIYRSDIFYGEQGISPARVDSLFGLPTLGSEYTFYYIGLTLFLLVLGFLWAITRSGTGDIFTAIREDERTVEASGFSPAKFKLFAFVTSGAVGGLAGAVVVHTPVGSASPSTFLSLSVNVEIIIASILGGMGTIVGAAIGGLLLVLFEYLLSDIEILFPLLGTPVSEINVLLFLVFTLALLYIFPGGLLRWVITGIESMYNAMRGDGGSEVAPDGGRKPIHQIYNKYKNIVNNMLTFDNDKR
jgi:branched-chain amino acid transport system permease protein